MRRCSNVKETWTAPDRVEPALKHLRTIAIKTAGLWTGVSNFVERPERYVLFVEIVEDANQMMGKRYVRGTTTASVPSIRLWSPDQKLKQENAMPTVSAAAASTNTRSKLEPGKVTLKRPLVDSMTARLRVNPVKRRSSPDIKELFSGYSCHAKEVNTTEVQTSDAPNELDMYYDADSESARADIPFTGERRNDGCLHHSRIPCQLRLFTARHQNFGPRYKDPRASL